MSASSSSESFSSSSEDGVAPKSSLETDGSDAAIISSDAWFQSGHHVNYDPNSKQIVHRASGNTISVFERIVPRTSTSTDSSPMTSESDTATSSSSSDDDECWLTFLPGFPEGSFCFAAVDAVLAKETEHESISLPILYLDYIGQGDSDSPDENYHFCYSSVERADLVQALWRHHGIRRTVIVAADSSSLVVAELLQRQRHEATSPRVAYSSSLLAHVVTRIEHVLSINGRYVAAEPPPRGFHPLSLLSPSNPGSPRFRKWGATMAQRSNVVLDHMLRRLYSKPHVRRHAPAVKQELEEKKKAIRRHHGSGILAQNQVLLQEQQQNARRWDLPRLFLDYARFQGISFTLVASQQDLFGGLDQLEQVHAQLNGFEPQVRFVRLEGGHFVCSEQTVAIVGLVRELMRQGQDAPQHQNIHPEEYEWSSLTLDGPSSSSRSLRIPDSYRLDRPSSDPTSISLRFPSWSSMMPP